MRPGGRSCQRLRLEVFWYCKTTEHAFGRRRRRLPLGGGFFLAYAVAATFFLLAFTVAFSFNSTNCANVSSGFPLPGVNLFLPFRGGSVASDCAVGYSGIVIEYAFGRRRSPSQGCGVFFAYASTVSSSLVAGTVSATLNFISAKYETVSFLSSPRRRNAATHLFIRSSAAVVFLSSSSSGCIRESRSSFELIPSAFHSSSRAACTAGVIGGSAVAGPSP